MSNCCVDWASRVLAEATESSRGAGIDLFGGIERYNTGLIIKHVMCEKGQNNGCQNNAYDTEEADARNGIEGRSGEKEFLGEMSHSAV